MWAFLCRCYNFEVLARHPRGAAEEAGFRRAVPLGHLEVIRLQVAFKGMDWVTPSRGSGEKGRV